MNWKSSLFRALTSAKWVRAGLAIAGLGALSVGCAQERDPINRVQANALAKSFFVGNDLHGTQDDPEFWTQGTLVDVGYGASQDGLFTSTYAQAVARVKWTITEDLLVARLTYQRIANSDGKGAGPASTDGQVVAAYKISSHFDIRNDYNPSTGEEYNVVVENEKDRPWYERQYFRVDWSQNLNTNAYDFDTMSILGLYGGIEYSSLAYYVNDPDDEDAPYFDVGNGYFDVTNKAFATPKMIDLSHLGWGIDKFPACMLPDELFGGSSPIGNCNAVELTIRQAYRRVVDSDYQPQDWDGYRFEAFGAFYTERLGYSRDYGMTDSNWHRFINRYNIWERSHYYADPQNMQGAVSCYTPDTLAYGEDPHADGNNDGTEDRCWMVTVNLATQAGADGCDASGTLDSQIACYNKYNKLYGGSRCDTFRQRCTLPYRFRKSKPLAWYYTSGSNQTYFEGTEWATHDHDVAMRQAIMTARYAECMATSGNDKTFCLKGDGDKAQPNPVYFGQMDDHLEAKQLAQEVDDCRHGLSHADFGAINSAEREAACVALADPANPDSAIAQRRAAGGSIDDAIGFLARQPEQIVLCHSPVEHNDPAVCAAPEQRLPTGMTAQNCIEAKANHDSATLAVCKAARNVRRGDLRFHQVNVLSAPQTPSPWGIYVDSRDPLTGEDFSASINVWSHVNDLWSQFVVDRIRYIKGELSTEQVTNGTFVHNWAQAAEAASGGQGIASRVTRQQLDQRVADYANITPEQVQQYRKMQQPALDQLIMQKMNDATSVMAAVDAHDHVSPTYTQLAKQAQGTTVEAELLTPAIQQLAGIKKGLVLDGPVLDQASPLRGANPFHVKQMNNMLEAALAERGLCMYNEAPAPMAISGLANILERKFEKTCGVYDQETCKYQWGKFGTVPTDPQINPENFKQARADAMRKYLAQRAQYAVIVHEMGHSVGMRHNFVSSSDAFSYRPQYWQLRTGNGKVTKECTDYTADGSACVGPRWFDPTTKEEQDNLIWMWMHSSVMDYAGEYTQDMIGLGAYDFGAHRMFYGEVSAVYDDPSYKLGQPRSKWLFGKMDNFGGLLGYRPTYNGADIHYSQYQKNYELIKGCNAVTPDAWKPASWDEAKQGAWDPLMDGLIVSVSGQATKCRQQQVDYRQWQHLRFPSQAELGGAGVTFYRGGPSVAIDGSGKVRVPYGFATDRWADLGNAAVYRHDNGADNYEVFDFLVTQQEVNHIFDDYRRGRNTFSVRAASNRTLQRYNEKIRDGAKGLGLLYNIYKDVAKEEGITFNSLWAYATSKFFPDQVLASSDVFDHFVRMYGRPEPGWHGIVTAGDGSQVLGSEADAYGKVGHTVAIPTGASLGNFNTVSYNGKPLENQLADNQGEYDAEYTMNAGSYYDKAWTPYLMAESRDNFISSTRLDFEDARYRSISLGDLFPDGYRRWVGNNLTGDTAVKGGAVASSNGVPITTQAPDGNKYPTGALGHVQWWTDKTQLCFPADGTTMCAAPGNPSTFGANIPKESLPLDPEVGWEQQKFLIAYTMIYLPENRKQTWVDMMRLWQLGFNADPGFDNRIEYHDPTGRVWVAKTFGTEKLTHVNPPRTVQKGIAARVLEWANVLLNGAYETTTVDHDGDGTVDWYLPKIKNGHPIVKYDPSKAPAAGPPPKDCNANDDSGCKCEDNWFCEELIRYNTIPVYLWESGFVFYGDPSMKGVYN